ncbi:MAG: hypothetical protein QXF26_10590 [Candidatus Bathyarchaeia archaeon]
MDLLDSRPIEQVILKEYVKSVVKVPSGWAMELSWDRPTKNIIISSRGVSMSLESSKLYIAYFNLVHRGSMDEAWKIVYREMYGMASTLEWRGVFRKVPRIVMSPGLSRLKTIFNSLQLSSRLADFLSADENLLSILADVKPDGFTIEVSAVPLQTDEPFQVQAIRSFNDPEEITFVCVLEKMMTRGIGYEKKFMSIMDLLDRAFVLASTLAKDLRAEFLNRTSDVIKATEL